MLLTQYNLDPLSVNDYGSTSLHHAVLGGREEVAELLITKYKCTVDCRNSRQQTPLHYACRKGHLNLVSVLVSKYKADLNARDEDNNEPLHEAALNGHSDVVKCLLDKFNCSPTVKGFQGRNILHIACSKDYDTLVRVLTEKFSMSLLSTDNKGNTPLHMSAMFQSKRSLLFLLDKCEAPIFIRNNAGRSVIDVADGSDVRKIIEEYLSLQHSRIIYDYKEVQKMSSKRYSGAHRVTRIFVVGNVDSGKSTLIESLKREGFFSSLNPVSEATVPPHTSGIIPSVHYSKTTGRVLFYDFAGDLEYYSSHSAILSNVLQSQSGTNIFFVVANLSKVSRTIQEELGYWFSFISYHSQNQSSKWKVLVVGSHADRLSSNEIESKRLLVNRFVEIFEHDASRVAFDVVDVVTINCRQPWSSRAVQSVLLKTIENAPRYRLTEEAAILLGLLEKDFKQVVTCEMQSLLTHIQDTGIYLPNTAESLHPIVMELHVAGLLMAIPSARLKKILLLLNMPKLTNEVHKLLFSTARSHQDDPTVPCYDGATMGILPRTYLNQILPEYISIDCLVQLQYCQEFSHAEVKCDCTVVPTDAPNAPSLLYFPALCTTDRKENAVTPDNHTYSIGWFTECQGKFDYFPARFLHVLLLRLAYRFAHPIAPSVHEGITGPHADIVKNNYGCTMWKNGLHWHMEEGVECIVELVNNNKGLVVITKSTEEEEQKFSCVNILFKIIDLAIQAKDEFCYTVTLKQYLMLLDANDTSSFKGRDKLFDLNDVVQVLRKGKASALSINRRWPIKTSRLAHLKRFIIGGE